ncbi:MAG: sigma 54 modulation/S30EA ribosomal C-terminal domain-containing protein [Nitrospinae bacterium]|nr:sigma 54 modulation/S30EA ribosomal C-terminal domain-containing protein [Nitrospinota bacterium]
MKSHKKRIIALKNKREAEIGEREGNIEGNIEETINIKKDIQGDDPEKPRVIKKRRLKSKPMTVEEAVKEMDILNSNFLVFTNSKNNKVNVLYQMKDGNYGLIEPN